MKKKILVLLILSLILFTACQSAKTKDTTGPTTTKKAETTTTTAPTEVPTTKPTEPEDVTYYVAGNFNGYVPNDPNYIMQPLEGVEGVYTLTVKLTEELRDPTYDGHWYKVTNGTWDKSWGTDNYELQPAPVKYTENKEPIGLGSIWIDADGEYTIIFDQSNLKIYDTSMVRELSPRIYGDFNTALGKGADWAFSDAEAILLEKSTTSGIYTAEVKLPAYTGTGEGYSMVVLTKVQYSAWLPWHGWGAIEQYKFDGTPAGMGIVSYVKPTAETTYMFSYNSQTHKTTVTTLTSPKKTEPTTTPAVTTAAPTVAPTTKPTEPKVVTYYVAGNFNGYVPNDPKYAMQPLEGVEGVYTLTVKLTEELRDPTYDGHWYKVTNGTWDKSWGTDIYELQPAPVKYTENKEPIGLGSIWIDADGDYTIIFDQSNLKIYDTSMVRELSPRIYGDFNTALGKGANWGFSDADAILLKENAEPGIYTAEVKLPAYTGTGEGYSMVVLTKVQYSAWLPWHGWGAVEQYLFDGNPAGMGIVSYLKPTVETTYVFSYNSQTHITKVTTK